MASTKWDVAVAICTGKFSKLTSAGYVDKTAAHSKQTQTKPTKILNTTPTDGLNAYW